ncbi:AFR550Cp [Eremothecium gossypii ATCC 10895]|uniref:AFR550Cp n=1 Tax=Eremothecium gossypii (strain ATCC 10895 / CBS 109.51 / FGSC 9923 / NRRL Y-1056) TaxID=284811 RepID=Q752M4_EREGS|nr:AFR550Cp [Eremothecium gossypii ATCC 10895]AAS53921.1 AFR550Cp [Eremothecium gossypii ATCC 10895]
MAERSFVRWCGSISTASVSGCARAMATPMECTRGSTYKAGSLYTREEQYLLSVTEMALSCSSYDEHVHFSNTSLNSTSTLLRSEQSGTSRPPQAHYNLLSREMEMSYGRELLKMAVLEPIEEEKMPVAYSDILRTNDAILRACRGQKVRYGLPPFMFISGASNGDNMIDANFLFTDDYEQFHYMQRYKNFPNANSLEYVRKMIQPYIEFLDELAADMAERRARYEYSDQHTLPPAKKGWDLVDPAPMPERAKARSHSLVSYMVPQKWGKLWVGMKKRAKFLNPVRVAKRI